jgi:hypothetical protein
MIHQNVSAKLNSQITDCFVLMITEILNKKRQLKVSRFGEDDESVPFEESEKEPRCRLCQKCNLI